MVSAHSATAAPAPLAVMVGSANHKRVCLNAILFVFCILEPVRGLAFGSAQLRYVRKNETNTSRFPMSTRSRNTLTFIQSNGDSQKKHLQRATKALKMVSDQQGKPAEFLPLDPQSAGEVWATANITLNAEETSLPVVSAMIVRIWPFLLSEGAVVILGLFVWSVVWVLNRSTRARVGILAAHVQILLIGLMICPLLRSSDMLYDTSPLWATALRCLIEMELLAFVCVALPASAIEFTSQALRASTSQSSSTHSSPQGLHSVPEGRGTGTFVLSINGDAETGESTAEKLLRVTRLVLNLKEAVADLAVVPSSCVDICLMDHSESRSRGTRSVDDKQSLKYSISIRSPEQPGQTSSTQSLASETFANLGAMEEEALSLKSQLRQNLLLLYLLMLLRSLICVYRAHFIKDEPFHSKLIGCCVNLALFIAALPSTRALFSSRKTTQDVDAFLTKTWQQDVFLTNFRNIIIALIMLAQVQDLGFLIMFGSERLAHIFASCLLIHEIAIAAFSNAVLLKSDKLLDTWSKVQAPAGLISRVGFLFTPQLLRLWAQAGEQECNEEYLESGRLLRSLHSDVERRSLGLGHQKACWRPTAEETHGLNADPPTYEVRSYWRTVLFDMFSPFTRSRLMPVMMLSLLLNHLYAVSPRINEKSIEYAPDPTLAPFLFTIMLTIIAFEMWLVYGLLLIGNNPFVTRKWLWLSIIGFAMEAFWNFKMFVKKPEEQDLWSIAHMWLYFTSGCVGLFGVFLALQAFFRGEGEGDYHNSQREAHQYVARLFKAVRGARVNLYAAWDYPPLLVAGAVAIVPVVMSLTLFVVYVGRTALHYARLAQVFALGMQGQADHADVFEAFDANYDGHLVPSEMGLSTLLSFAGVPELARALSGLWSRVDEDDDGKLSVSEAREFMARIWAARAALASWIRDDAAVASQQLVIALDAEPQDGALSPDELPPEDISTVIQTTSPEASRIVSKEIQAIWRASDVSGDNKLDANELPALITKLKNRAVEVQTAIREVCFNLVQEAASVLRKSKRDVMNRTGAVVGEGKNRALEIWHKNQQILKDLSEQTSRSSRYQALADRIAKHLVLATEGALSLVSAARGVLLACLKVFSPLFAQTVESELKELDSGTLNGTALLTLTGGKASSASPLALRLVGDKSELAELDPSLAAALPDILQQAMPTIQDGVARALLLLDLVEGDPAEGAAVIMEALDVPPRDGRVGADELGLTYMLDLISPSLASWAADLTRYVGAGENGELNEKDVAQILRYSQTLIRDYVGDLDGDGEVTRWDLGHAVAGAAQDAYSQRPEETQASPTASPAPAAVPAHHDGFAQTFSKSQTHANASMVVTGAAHSEGSSGHLLQSNSYKYSFLQLRLERSSLPLLRPGLEQVLSGAGSLYPEGFVHYVADLNLVRIEACLYISALLSLFLGCYIVRNTFVANRRIFTMLQGNNHDWKGSKSLPELVKRPDYSTFYPGMLFSTVLLAILTTFTLSFSVLVLGTSFEFWKWIWHNFGEAILWISATFLVSFVFLRLIIMDWYCMKDGEVVNPRIFSCLWVVLTLVNFAVGALGAISRFFFILPFAYLRFLQLDQTILDEENMIWDFGVVTFLTTVGLNYEHLNPVRRAFVAEVMPAAHRLYGPLPKETLQNEGKAKSQTRRNKWWLLKLLAENPSLARERRQPDVFASK